MLNGKDFQYVDIHAAVNGQHQKWQRVNVERVKGVVDQIGSKADIYTTVQHFCNPQVTENEPEYCPLPFDFDCSSDVTRAQVDCCRLVEHIINVYGADINPEEMMVYYSGNRGFHVTINPELFEAEPMVEMIKVWRILAESIIKLLNLQTADRAIYTRRRAWRVPNTRHSKSGLYKIPVDYKTLSRCGIDEIKVMAKEPDKDLYLLEVI